MSDLIFGALIVAVVVFVVCYIWMNPGEPFEGATKQGCTDDVCTWGASDKDLMRMYAADVVGTKKTPPASDVSAFTKMLNWIFGDSMISSPTMPAMYVPATTPRTTSLQTGLSGNYGTLPGPYIPQPGKAKPGLVWDIFPMAGFGSRKKADQKTCPFGDAYKCLVMWNEAVWEFPKTWTFNDDSAYQFDGRFITEVRQAY